MVCVAPMSTLTQFHSSRILKVSVSLTVSYRNVVYDNNNICDFFLSLTSVISPVSADVYQLLLIHIHIFMKDNISFPKSLKFNNISILQKLADSITFCLLRSLNQHWMSVVLEYKISFQPRQKRKRKLQLKNYIKKIREKNF